MDEREIRSDHLRDMQKTKLELLVLEKNGWLEKKHSEAENLFPAIDFTNPARIEQQVNDYSELQQQIQDYSPAVEFHMDDPDPVLRTACRKFFSIEETLERKRTSFRGHLDRRIDALELDFQALGYSSESISSFIEIGDDLKTLQDYAQKVGYGEGSLRLQRDIQTIQDTVVKIRGQRLTNPDEPRFDNQAEKRMLDSELEAIKEDFMSYDWEDPRNIKSLRKVLQEVSVVRDKYDILADAKGLDISSRLETECERRLARLEAKRKKTIGMRISKYVGVALTIGFLAEVSYNIDNILPRAEELYDNWTRKESVAIVETVPEPKPTRLQATLPDIRAEPKTMQYSVAALPVRDNQVPYSLESIAKKNTDYKTFIYIDKKENVLHLYEYLGNRLEEVFSSRTSDGRAQGPKRKIGDNKTPEGVYRIEGCWECGTDPLFGVAALRIGYPNKTDLQYERTGGGILICGTGIPERERAIENGKDCSNGSIIMHNTDLRKIYDYIAPLVGKTLVIIEDPSRPLVQKAPEVLG
ncbi:MAG: L,D-transpeptidase family protein [archaeon]